jgi:phosphatidylglycerol:prolipoprotein diacylglycerol transferase
VLQFPRIDPVIVELGPLQLRWYGLMYILGFAASYFLFLRQVRDRGLHLSKALVQDLYFWLIVGLLVGARVGYVLFYNLPYYLEHPLEALAFWRGGMSFHGGLLGVLLSGYWFCRRRGLSLLPMADAFVPTTPPGLFFGRLGNFINAELYGRPTELPWGMVFPDAGPQPRHPSQLYEAALEGLLLFALMCYLRGRIRFPGGLLAAFLVLYGTLRFLAEFFREPDPQLGLILGPFSMGQVLSALMVAAGFALFVRQRKRR